MANKKSVAEELLQEVDAYEAKQQETWDIIEELITVCRTLGDERNAVKAEDELGNIMRDTNRDATTVKSYVSAMVSKQYSPGAVGDEPFKKVSENTVDHVPTSKAEVERNLERLQVPKFDGDKLKFASFWAAFSAIVDETSALPRYKMLRLKACLEGNAAEAIAKLGYLDEAYEEAKRTLIRKFGGDRRQIQAHLENLRATKSFQDDDVLEIERFSDSLVHSIVTLKEQKQWNELRPNSTLYLLLIEKVPRSMLSRFFRWLSEKVKEETLESLSDWLVEETEFLIHAMETKEGMSVKKTSRDKRPHRNFATVTDGRQRNCACCNKIGHGVWSCAKFKDGSVAQRWALAKEKQLCYRCLSDHHLGRNCPRTRVCGLEGCKRNHHQLLHDSERKDQQETDRDGKERLLKPIPDPKDGNTSASQEQTGIEKKTYIATLAVSQSSNKAGSFRTVPVWLKANGQKIRVNAVLDDASSASYISEEVAGVLGLSAPYEPVTVQVLNENIETFDTMPVDLVLESSDGSVQVSFRPFTCPRKITGSYKVVDWRGYQNRWPHLEVCNFPKATKDPLVDVLIGQDQVDLHYARCDVKGKPGEPIARLGPLGWSCIGNPEEKSLVCESLRTNLVYTFFAKFQPLEELNRSLKRFWELESVMPEEEPCVMSQEEKWALSQLRESLVKVGERYQVAVPWKGNRPVLANNYETALKRLENTEYGY
ncbi:uncharacterized protein LOC114530429 [Dendronephthya gigantea]|uniref:uncharacterized protein LOC114530429 n=1 Tax=Dendronephthya gigantea TaxID=151771 RepID=UPI00106B73DB|nr:uncharacterized protein LOC114530429 [Dendronephthya gigantea]